MLRQVLENGKVLHEEIDVSNLGIREKSILVDSILTAVEDDNEKFIQRVGIDISKIEVRFEHLTIEGDAYVGSRALPTILNSALNAIEEALGFLKILPSKRKVVNVLNDVSGIVKPSRITLLLGPPGSGKTTLLKALDGKMDKDLRTKGRVAYHGHEMHEFNPQRTSAYIGQDDLHHGIKPDPEIDVFMKATAMAGQGSSLVSDYVLKILGLDICADIMVGNEMRRSMSGGQKKRLTADSTEHKEGRRIG